jgi:hypothetical protein
MDRLGATPQVDRQEQSTVPGFWVARAGTVRSPAFAQALNDAAAHEGLEAQSPKLFMKLATPPLVLFSLGCHV